MHARGKATDPQREQPVDVGPPAEAVTAALDKILSSHHFQNAEGQKAFLHYVVSETLAGRGDQLKEYTIGVEVCQRKETYDPRYDNTVRLRAQKLRWSLARYYEAEGKGDPICIGFRPRGYQPIFGYRLPATPDEQKTELLEEVGHGDALTVASDEQSIFSIIPDVAHPNLLTEPGLLAEPHLLAQPHRSGKWQFRAAICAALLACATISYIAGAKRWLGTKDRTIDSIAVLPLRTLGGDSEFLGSGLTADLTDSLSHIPGMGVTAPASAAIYKGKIADVREVGSRLNVRAVLDGSIQQVGNRVQIRLLLSDTGNGLPIWSATYDQEVKDIFQTKMEISDTVTTAVRARLTDSLTRESEGISTGGTVGFGAGEAHARLGEAYAIDFQWSRADPEFIKAVELSPNRVTVRRSYANYLQKVGRLADAETQIRMDPYSPTAITVSNLAKNRYFGRRYKEAIEEYQKAIKIFESSIFQIHADLGMAYVFNGMGHKGIEELEFAHHGWTGMTTFSGQLGYAYGVQGRTEDAQKILSELLNRSDQGDSLSTAIAQVYIGLGNKDKAFEWLNKAVMQRDGDLFLKVDPIYDTLRSDPRFRTLLHSMNFS